MSTLSTAAWIAHDVGLAVNFGGPLFGKLALGPAVRVVSSEEERGRLMTRAWKTFNIAMIASLTTATATWIAGRQVLSGRAVGERARALVVAKDVLLGAAVVVGVAGLAADAALVKQAGMAPPIVSGLEPSDRLPAPARKAQVLSNVFGLLHAGAVAGVIGVTAMLAMESGRSGRFGLVSRLLP